MTEHESTTDNLESDILETLAAGGPAEPMPESIGPYRILDKLGAGGMGSVFLAEQTEPVKRTVALKVMRSRFLDREGRIRFESERQAMARLQHPFVAQIFEAGATEEGHPYFVMEHVKGERITDFCDHHRLTVEQRLELFCDVCVGVQHAHQKGIIHRDLKPSNILVTMISGRPNPKIIDFGIAKALDQPLSEGTLVTGDRLVGTPAYLSPEAAHVGPGQADLDTRSDVYSLGILLYELLVGHRPFDDEKSNMFQVLQRIAVEEPTGPSTRWSGLDVSTRDAVAAQRLMDPATFKSSLRGDLDWIVLKALAKDRQQRYDSATELSADIGRHLRHEPVEASPPSTLYRLGKFVRRRSGTVVAVALVLFALLGGIAARTLEARRANREKAAAVEARQQTEIALEKAEQARAETEQMAQFLVGLFKVADPGAAKGNSVTARELLDAGADEIRSGFEDQPLTRARLMQTIADVYRKLGLYEPSEELFVEAIRLRRRHHPGDHLETAASLNGLAALRAQLGRYVDAEPLFRESLAIRERVYGPDHLEVAMSLSNLGNIVTDQGRQEEAAKLYQRAMVIVEAYEGPPTQDLLVVLNNLAAFYSDHAEHELAEPLLRRFLAYQKQEHGEKHPHVAIGYLNLAEVRWKLGSAEEAEQLFEQAIEILSEVLAPDHPEVGYGLSTLASMLAEQGRSDEAAELFRQALAIQQVALPEDHPELQASVAGLAKLQ